VTGGESGTQSAPCDYNMRCPRSRIIFKKIPCDDGDDDDDDDDDDDEWSEWTSRLVQAVV